MAFDRSKIKKVSVDTVEKAQKDAQKATGNSGSKFERLEYFKLKDPGTYWFRICPPFDGVSPYQAFETGSLPCMEDVWDKGEKTGEQKLNPYKNVFTSITHSPKDEDGNRLVSKDPIYTYINYCWKLASEKYGDGKDQETKDKKKDFLNPVINSFPQKNGKWHIALKPQLNYKCYAWDKSGKLGVLQLYGSQLERMREISVRETPEDSPTCIDVFSSPDEGFPLIITKTKSDGGKMKTTLDAESLGRGESWDDFFKRNMVTDVQLEQWSKLKPMHEKYGECYGESDFNLAIDGLQRFDEQHGYGIFANDEFLDEIELINDMVEALPKKNKESEESAKDEAEAKAEKEEPKSAMEKLKEMGI